MIGLCVALYKALSADESLAAASPAPVVTQRPVPNGAGQEVATEPSLS